MVGAFPSQQEVYGLYSGPVAFLCRVCRFYLHLCVFAAGSPAPSNIPETNGMDTFVSLWPSDDLLPLVQGITQPSPQLIAGIDPIILSGIDDGWKVVENLCKGFLVMRLAIARSKSHCVSQFQLLQTQT